MITKDRISMDDKEVERRLKQLSKENNKTSPDKDPKKNKKGRNTIICIVIAAVIVVVAVGAIRMTGVFRPVSDRSEETEIAEAKVNDEALESGGEDQIEEVEVAETEPDEISAAEADDEIEAAGDDDAEQDDAVFGEELEAEKIAEGGEFDEETGDYEEETASSEADSVEIASAEETTGEDASTEENESDERQLSGWAAAAVASKEFKEIAASGDFEYVSLDAIPAFDGDPYVIVNGNEPFFTDSDYTTEVFETYSDLDGLGRCGPAYANLCKELMPTGRREYIRNIYPSGYHNTKYSFIDGEYVYNRCHLIAFSLAGESANEKNLITGTQYMNIDGMYPFEYMVGDYIRRKNNHVLYRVTPIYEGDNLVASGVLIEGSSVEDKGEGLNFCVYCYNVQPGVAINYATGRTQSDGTMG